ncbi:MAG TPA: M56 family metallopeptidase [Longimicrobiaceae bacterium]
MITWMTYALIASALLAGAGVALEQATGLLRRPRRWGWLAVMLLAVGLPVLFRFLPAETPRPSRTAPMDPALLAELLAHAQAGQAEVGILDRILHAPAAGPILLTAWLTLTVAIGLTLWVAYHRLRRVRASGVPVQIAGFPAILTESTGPVVIGVGKPEIVLPRWIDLLSEEERKLVVRHEWEHMCAGDPRLLMLAAMLVAAMPWNLPLWWMRTRLRQALELDCDARVLASGADRRTYGTILIQTASRPGPAPLLAPALLEPPTLLERRIVAMTGRIPAHRRMRIAVASGLGALMFIVACEMTPRGGTPSPTEPQLADVLEPEAPGVSERVVIQMSADDSAGAIAHSLSPEGEVTVIRVGPDGDTTEIRDMRIKVSPLDELAQDGPQPLYIVDGERVESIEQLDPSRIVSIDVLKGPLALEQFGPDAENGVVQIQTGEPGGTVQRESSASVERERALEIARDGVGVRLEDREPGESRLQIFNPGNPDAQPLVIVDGKRGVSLDELDPARIDRIEVFKGSEAIERYGPEAKDGVIIVTTRSVARERASAATPVGVPNRVNAEAMIDPNGAPRLAAPPLAVRKVAPSAQAVAPTPGTPLRVKPASAPGEGYGVGANARAVKVADGQVANLPQAIAVPSEQAPDATAAPAVANVQAIAAQPGQPVKIVEDETVSSDAESEAR